MGTVVCFNCTVSSPGLQHHQWLSSPLLGFHFSCCDESWLLSPVLPPPSLAGLLHRSPATVSYRFTQAPGHLTADVYPHEGGVGFHISLLQLRESKEGLWVQTTRWVWRGFEKSTGTLQETMNKHDQIILFLFASWDKCWLSESVHIIISNNLENLLSKSFYCSFIGSCSTCSNHRTLLEPGYEAKGIVCTSRLYGPYGTPLFVNSVRYTRTSRSAGPLWNCGVERVVNIQK